MRVVNCLVVRHAWVASWATLLLVIFLVLHFAFEVA